MIRLRQTLSSQPAVAQRNFVYVGDSISYAESGAYPMRDAFTRLGDLIARSLCTKGIIRYNGGYYLDVGAGESQKLWDRATRTMIQNWDLISTNASERATKKIQCQALASSYDVIYHNLAIAGTMAGNWHQATSPDKYTPIGTGFSDWIDFLVVQFGWNEVANAWTTTQYKDGLKTRLGEWTNVGKKALLLSWISSSSNTDGTLATARDDYYQAALEAASESTPGICQSSIPVYSLHENGFLARNGGANTWTHDGVHLTAAGARFFMSSGLFQSEFGMMRL